MPYSIRKIRNQNAYTVKNTETGQVHSHHTSRKNALAQVRLLRGIDHGMKVGKGNTPPTPARPALTPENIHRIQQQERQQRERQARQERQRLEREQQAQLSREKIATKISEQAQERQKAIISKNLIKNLTDKYGKGSIEYDIKKNKSVWVTPSKTYDIIESDKEAKARKSLVGVVGSGLLDFLRKREKTKTKMEPEAQDFYLERYKQNLKENTKKMLRLRNLPAMTEEERKERAETLSSTPERMRMLIGRTASGRRRNGGTIPKQASVEEPAMSKVANTPGLLQKIHNTVHRSQEDASHPNEQYTLRHLPFHEQVNEGRIEERFQQVIPFFEALNDAYGESEPFYNGEALDEMIRGLVEEDSPILYLPQEQQIDWFVREMAKTDLYNVMERLQNIGIQLPEQRIIQLIHQANNLGIEYYADIVDYIVGL